MSSGVFVFDFEEHDAAVFSGGYEPFVVVGYFDFFYSSFVMGLVVGTFSVDERVEVTSNGS